MQRVAIIDYGSGNLHSAAKAFERAARESEADAEIDGHRRSDIVAAADRIVLPGVGAFADCKRGLEAVAGHARGAGRRACASRADRSSASASACSSWRRAGSNSRSRDGLDWIAGEVRAIEPNDPA